MKKPRPKRDWAERAAARLYSAMLPHFSIVDKCEAQIVRALRRAEDRGYKQAMRDRDVIDSDKGIERDLL